MADVSAANNGIKPSSVARNAFSISGKHAVIFVPFRKTAILKAIIDADQIERVIAHGLWRATLCSDKHLYVYCSNNGVVYLHRFVTNAPKGMLVDHRNHDGLINTSENLRVVTKAINTLNRRGAQTNNRTGLRGVSKHIRSGYNARVNGRSLGYYRDPIVAALRVQFELASLDALFVPPVLADNNTYTTEEPHV